MHLNLTDPDSLGPYTPSICSEPAQVVSRGLVNSPRELEDMHQGQWSICPPGRVMARFWGSFKYHLSQAKRLHLYKSEKGDKRQAAKILDGVLGVLGC